MRHWLHRFGMNLPRPYQPLALVKSYLLTFEERVPWCFMFNGWYKHRDAWTEYVKKATSTDQLAVSVLLFESAIKPWAQCQAFGKEPVPEILVGLAENTSDMVTDLNLRRLKRPARANKYDDDEEEEVEVEPNENRRWGKRGYCTAIPSKKQHAAFVWLSARAASILGKRHSPLPVDPTDVGGSAENLMDITGDNPSHLSAAHEDIKLTRNYDVAGDQPSAHAVDLHGSDAETAEQTLGQNQGARPDLSGIPYWGAKSGRIRPGLWKSPALAGGHSARMDLIFARAVEISRRKCAQAEERKGLEAVHARFHEAAITAQASAQAVDPHRTNTDHAEQAPGQSHSAHPDLTGIPYWVAKSGRVRGDAVGSTSPNEGPTFDTDIGDSSQRDFDEAAEVVRTLTGRGTDTEAAGLCEDAANKAEVAVGPRERAFEEARVALSPGENAPEEAGVAVSLCENAPDEGGIAVRPGENAPDETEIAVSPDNGAAEVAELSANSGNQAADATSVATSNLSDNEAVDIPTVPIESDGDGAEVAAEDTCKGTPNKAETTVSLSQGTVNEVQVAVNAREDVTDDANAATSSSQDPVDESFAAAAAGSAQSDADGPNLDSSDQHSMIVDNDESPDTPLESELAGSQVSAAATVTPVRRDSTPLSLKMKSSKLCQKSKFCGRESRHRGKCNDKLEGAADFKFTESGPKKKRAVRCKACGELGHMAKTCKKRVDSILTDKSRRESVGSASRRSSRATKSTRIYNAGVDNDGFGRDGSSGQASKSADFSPKFLEHEPETCYEIEKVAQCGLGEHRNMLRISTRLLRKAARRGGCDKFPGILYRTQGIFPVCRTLWRIQLAKARTASALLLGLSVLEASINWSSWSGLKTRNQNRRNQEGHITVIDHRVSDWRMYFLAKICEIKYDLQDGTPYPTYREEWLREDHFPKLYEVYKYLYAIKKTQDEERARVERERAASLRTQQIEAEREARRQQQLRKAEEHKAAEAARRQERKRKEVERQRTAAAEAARIQIAAEEREQRARQERQKMQQMTDEMHRLHAGMPVPPHATLIPNRLQLQFEQQSTRSLAPFHSSPLFAASTPQLAGPAVVEHDTVRTQIPLIGYGAYPLASVATPSFNRPTHGPLSGLSAAHTMAYGCNQLGQYGSVHPTGAAAMASGWTPMSRLPWGSQNGVPAQSMPLGLTQRQYLPHQPHQLQMPMYQSRIDHDAVGHNWDGPSQAWEKHGSTVVRQNKDAKQRAKKLAAFRKEQKRKKAKAQKDAIAKEKQACKGTVKWIVDQVIQKEKNEAAEINRIIRQREREKRDAARIAMELAKQQQVEAKREARRQQKMLQEQQRRERALNKYRGSLHKHVTRIEVLKLALLHKLEDDLHKHSRGGKRNRSGKRSVADKKGKQDFEVVDTASSAEIELYCICQTPSDPTRSYVWCDGCSNWYHYECVGYTADDAATNHPFWCQPCKSVRYFAEEDDTARSIAVKLGSCTAAELVAVNRSLIPGINQTIPVKAGTPFVVPGRAPVKHPPPLISLEQYKAQQPETLGESVELKLPSNETSSVSCKKSRNASTASKQGGGSGGGNRSKSEFAAFNKKDKKRKWGSGDSKSRMTGAIGDASNPTSSKRKNQKQINSRLLQHDSASIRSADTVLSLGPSKKVSKKIERLKPSSKSPASAATKHATLSLGPSKNKKNKPGLAGTGAASNDTKGVMLSLGPPPKKKKKKLGAQLDKSRPVEAAVTYPSSRASNKKKKTGVSASGAADKTSTDSFPLQDMVLVARAPFRPQTTKKKSSMKRILPDLAVQMELLLRAMYLDDVSHPFRDPVTDEIAPSYSSIIARPMDLTRIAQKLADRQYVSIDQFEADINLIVSNCHLYNEPLSHIGLEASALLARYRLMVQAFGPAAWGCALTGELRLVLKKALKGVLSDPDSVAFREPVSLSDRVELVKCLMLCACLVCRVRRKLLGLDVRYAPCILVHLIGWK